MRKEYSLMSLGIRISPVLSLEQKEIKTVGTEALRHALEFIMKSRLPILRLFRPPAMSIPVPITITAKPKATSTMGHISKCRGSSGSGATELLMPKGCGSPSGPPP